MLIFLALCVAFVAMTPPSLATVAYDGQFRVSVSRDKHATCGFDEAEMQSKNGNCREPARSSLLLTAFSKFLAAETTVGDILVGHSPDTMIHLTTATEQELATATFPHLTPPHTTPGVFQGSSWVQLGDLSHMAVPEYQQLVVGPAAAGYGNGVSAFVTNPPSSVFTPVNVPNLGGVQEFMNGAVVKPGTYVPLPGKP